jgi:(2Fe-2S) ferredoxin
MSEERASDLKAQSLRVATYGRHIFMCAGPECCSEAVGGKVWDHLKARLKERGLAAPGGTGQIFRTRAHCLRICCEGPIAVVYPEGIWYRFVDQNAVDRIIDEHLIQGRPVEDYILGRNSVIGRTL